MSLSSWKTLDLRDRFILLVLLVFLVFSGVIGWDFVIDRDQEINAAKKELLSEVKVLAARQQSLVAQADAIMSGLTLNPELQPGEATGPCMQAFLARLKQHEEFIQAGLVLPNGELACAAAPPNSHVNFADRSWFPAALASRKMVISEVVIGRILGKPIVVFAKAMRDQTDRVTGIFFLSLNLDWLRHDLGTISLPESARLVVVDAKGTVAVNLPDPGGYVSKHFENAPLLQHIRSAHSEGTTEDIGADGERRLFAYAKLLDTVSGPMHVWLTVPKDRIEAPARRAALLGLGVMLALLLGMLGLVVWAGNRLVIVPMLTLSRAAMQLGAGDLGARSGLPHGDDEIGRLARILDETAAAIQDRERRLARANRALRTQFAANEALVRATSEEGLLQMVTRTIVEVGGYRLATVSYADDNPEKNLRSVAWVSAGEDFFPRERRTWADTKEGQVPIARTVRSGTPQICRDIAGDPGFAPWRESALSRGYASNIGLPLLDGVRCFGGLSIYSAEKDAFDEDEARLLTELANDLAYGIVTLRTRAERDRIAYEHEHHAEILQKSLEQSIKAIADTVEARDPYTAGHQRRVGELAVAIARELGLPEEKVHGIHLAAIIHDLGKIHVPAEILSKPSKLTDIEFMLIKTHPQAGYEILKDVDFPWPIADIVRQHHEKLDGSGYPQGLKGGQILLESRIMTVADVVEAMASHRPYRAALGIEVALKEIERGRGSAYDPAVADACLKLFREGRFAFQG